MMKNNRKEEKFLRYTSLVGAVFGVNQAMNAQVVWTDIPDTTLSKSGAFYDFNIDNDTSGIIDFRITQIIDSTTSDINGVIIGKRGSINNQTIGLDYGNYNYPFKLNVGDRVGSGEPFKGINDSKNIGYLAFEALGSTYPNSQFTNGVTDGFLGLKFQAFENDTIRDYFGWIRLDLAADYKSVTIKDYAYMAIEDSAIMAGEGSPISLEEFAQENIKFVQNDNRLNIELGENFDPNFTLKILSLSGQLVSEHKLNGRKQSWEIANLPKGIHIALLNTNRGDYTIKIVSY